MKSQMIDTGISLLKTNPVLTFIFSSFSMVWISMMNNHVEIIKLIIVLFFLDLATGLVKAYKKHKISSWGLWGWFEKFTAYLCFIYILEIFAIGTGISWITWIVFWGIIAREIVSLIENFDEIWIWSRIPFFNEIKNLLRINAEMVEEKARNKMLWKK